VSQDLEVDSSRHNRYFLGQNGPDSWFASPPKSEELNLPTFLFPMGNGR
jgi:hypothetical protein